MKTKLYFTALMLLTTMTVFAQPAPPATPIDGGLGLLLAGGVAYGAKKLLGKRK